MLQAVLAAAFIMAGFAKVTGAPQMVAAFEAIGFGQWFRYLIGALELAGAVALLIPRLAGLAGLAFVGLMVGAVITDLSLGATPLPALTLLIPAALIAWGRRRDTVRLYNTLLRR